MSLGFEPGTEGWKAEMNPLSNGDPEQIGGCLPASKAFGKEGIDESLV